MIVNEIAKFWKPLQLAIQLLLVAELGEPRSSSVIAALCSVVLTRCPPQDVLSLGTFTSQRAAATKVCTAVLWPVATLRMSRGRKSSDELHKHASTSGRVPCARQAVGSRPASTCSVPCR